MATPNGNGTNGQVGKVVQIIGPVVDVEFGEKYLPPILLYCRWALASDWKPVLSVASMLSAIPADR